MIHEISASLKYQWHRLVLVAMLKRNQQILLARLLPGLTTKACLLSRIYVVLEVAPYHNRSCKSVAVGLPVQSRHPPQDKMAPF